MKILFVHEVSWRKKVVYEIHDFPELLSLRGHNVSFLEYDEDEGELEHHGFGHNQNLMASFSTHSRAHPGSEVRVVTPRRFLPGILGRLLAVVMHPFVIYGELRNNRPDVIVLYAVPTNGWQTTLIAKKMRIPVVFRAIDISHKLRKSVFSKLIANTERIVYQNVGHISTHNYALKEYVASYMSGLEEISVLLPGVDLERFCPKEPSKQLQQRLGIHETDQVILFMGTIFRFAGIVEFLEHAVTELRRMPSVKLLILGDGEDLGRVRKRAQELGLTGQVITPGRVPYDELAENLRLGTVAILPFLKENVTDFALPAKVAQYLSCGLPTVSVKLRGLASVIPEGSGVLYRDDLEGLASTTLELLKDLEHRNQLSKEARKTMVELCSWENQVTKFENLLSEIQMAYK
jgi:glycosyltransferase involved in cell wall biosynthesis